MPPKFQSKLSLSRNKNRSGIWLSKTEQCRFFFFFFFFLSLFFFFFCLIRTINVFLVLSLLCFRCMAHSSECHLYIILHHTHHWLLYHTVLYRGHHFMGILLGFTFELYVCFFIFIFCLNIFLVPLVIEFFIDLYKALVILALNLLSAY